MENNLDLNASSRMKMLVEVEDVGDFREIKLVALVDSGREIRRFTKFPKELFSNSKTDPVKISLNDCFSSMLKAIGNLSVDCDEEECGNYGGNGEYYCQDCQDIHECLNCKGTGLEFDDD